MHGDECATHLAFRSFWHHLVVCEKGFLFLADCFTSNIWYISFSCEKGDLLRHETAYQLWCLALMSVLDLSIVGAASCPLRTTVAPRNDILALAPCVDVSLGTVESQRGFVRSLDHTVPPRNGISALASRVDVSPGPVDSQRCFVRSLDHTVAPRTGISALATRVDVSLGFVVSQRCFVGSLDYMVAPRNGI